MVARVRESVQLLPVLQNSKYNDNFAGKTSCDKARWKKNILNAENISLCVCNILNNFNRIKLD